MSQVKPRPSENNPTPCSPKRRNQSGQEAGLKRTNEELGSTMSLQVQSGNNAWVRLDLDLDQDLDLDWVRLIQFYL